MPVKFGEHYANGEVLSYHLTYVETSFGVSWQALVRDAEGALLGAPRGLMPGAKLSTPDLDQQLVTAVQAAIAAMKPSASGV